jgi:hypothetical protein
LTLHWLDLPANHERWPCPPADHRRWLCPPSVDELGPIDYWTHSDPQSCILSLKQSPLDKLLLL